MLMYAAINLVTLLKCLYHVIAFVIKFNLNEWPALWIIFQTKSSCIHTCGFARNVYCHSFQIADLCHYLI